MAASPARGANLYPWDVVGDPACGERLRAAGVESVALAAAYHTVRAVTPRHPRHKVVTAPHSAVYFRLDEGRWRGRELRPAAFEGSTAMFGPAARQLAAAGLGVYAWVVLAHNQRLGTLHPDHAVVNAYGDRYPWALCVSSDEVVAYCAALAADAARQPHVTGVELESCGWYGFDHLHAHDKTGGAATAPAAKLPLSLCFCAHCAEGYADAGLDAARLRREVRVHLDEVFAGRVPPPLDGGTAAGIAAMRVRAADRLRAAALAAVRAEAPGMPVLLHGHPDPLAVGANAGMAPAALFGPGGADGVLVACQTRSAAALDAVRAFAAEAGRARVVASVSIVSGLGADLADLPAWTAELSEAGASELRYYHGGLASEADLAALTR